MNLMRNKRSVVLDLKQDAGRDAFVRIAATSDVVVTNLRPGALARLRLTYDDVVAVRPGLVYCQATGFPSDSPRADDPAYDDIIQSASGWVTCSPVSAAIRCWCRHWWPTRSAGSPLPAP